VCLGGAGFWFGCGHGTLFWSSGSLQGLWFALLDVVAVVWLLWFGDVPFFFLDEIRSTHLIGSKHFQLAVFFAVGTVPCLCSSCDVIKLAILVLVVNLSLRCEDYCDWRNMVAAVVCIMYDLLSLHWLLFVLWQCVAVRKLGCFIHLLFSCVFVAANLPLWCFRCSLLTPLPSP
jgi:hypothetical protein